MHPHADEQANCDARRQAGNIQPGSKRVFAQGAKGDLDVVLNHSPDVFSVLRRASIAVPGGYGAGFQKIAGWIIVGCVRFRTGGVRGRTEGACHYDMNEG